MRVVIEFEWRDLGGVQLESNGSLRFPTLPAEPGIYRFAISEAARTAVYIGEADNLRRRMQNYRTPGNSQPTNRRLNDELKRVLASGGAVGVSVMTAARLEMDADQALVNLRHKAYRVLVEHAALVPAIHKGTDAVINLAKESGTNI
jgi:hypothetical protein